MTTLTLVGFLRARLDEDEAVAREAFEAAEREPVSFRPMEGARTAGALSVMEMMVRWHPARILADVEAKRRIVEHCEPDTLALHPGDDYVLRLLALPYAAHPDYDERWRP